ncbi:hypothetical protein ACW2Q0_01480 [Nocardia sp. R16R-3T]
MTSENIVTAVLALAVLGWIIYRQNQWRRFEPARMWRLPLILGIVGAFVFAESDEITTVRAHDIALLVLEGALSLGVGVVMGAMSRFERDADGALLVRTGALASALWLVLIAVRIGIGVLAVDAGAAAVGSAGVIIMLIAVNRVGRIAVVAARAERSTDSGAKIRAH